MLLTNRCIYDCQYCVNRRSNDVRRAAFTPRELCELTMGFYRRNYIEGLFLSSAVWGSPDRTTELMIETLRLLREEYAFGGYIHAKAIPGADPLLTHRLGLLADRLSVNIELPSEQSLGLLAPDKAKASILTPMAQIRDGIAASKGELAVYRNAPRFAPAGQSTQMIVGATPETDFQILRLTEGLYKKYRLKRVFFSAYMPVSDSKLLPRPRASSRPCCGSTGFTRRTGCCGFTTLRPASCWTRPTLISTPWWTPSAPGPWPTRPFFPVEVNTADYEALLRVPGIGVTSARRILSARRWGPSPSRGSRSWGWCSSGPSTFSPARGKRRRACG